MAKEDFCFTYYDGDAARDMAHMNRLERGAYTDIIISQRKFGHLTVDQMKKILGKDFEECFGAIELILSKDEESKYFIEWVEASVDKSKKNSKKNKDRISKYWNGKNDTNLIPNPNLEEPNQHLVLPKTVLEEPLEYENGNEDIKDKGGIGGELPIGLKMQNAFLEKNSKYPSKPGQDIPAIVEFANFINKEFGGKNEISYFDSQEKNNVLREWGRICEWYTAKGNNKSLEYLSKFKMQEIISELRNGTKNQPNGTNYSTNTKQQQDAARNRLLQLGKEQFFAATGTADIGK